MKAQQLIADALSEWRPVQDAPDLAQQLFDRLDEDEVQRLAVRGFTDEIRASLRRKDSDGLPTYANIERVDKAGQHVRVYKQTSLFSIDDYKVAADSYRRRANANLRVVAALEAACLRLHNINIALPGMEAPAAAASNT